MVTVECVDGHRLQCLETARYAHILLHDLPRHAEVVPDPQLGLSDPQSYPSIAENSAMRRSLAVLGRPFLLTSPALTPALVPPKGPVKQQAGM